MQRYRFRLEGVARVRRLQEDLAKGALAAANQDVVRADDLLIAEKARYLDLLSVTDVPGAGTDGLDAFLARRCTQEAAARTVIAAHARRAVAIVEADERRREWAAAAQRVQALDRLDQRRRAEHEVDASRAEIIEVDDIVVSRHRAAALAIAEPATGADAR